MRLTPRRLAMLCGAIPVFIPSAAVADEATQRRACEESYVAAQSLRRDGKLLLARDALLVCSHDPCAPDLKIDCEKWATENDKSTPSVVVTLRDRLGQYVTQGKVIVDNRVAGELRGRAIELDPGVHEIRIDGVSAVKVQRIVLPEGDQRHALLFVEEPAPEARPKWPLYLAGGVAMLGAAGIAGFGLEGLHARSSSCPGGSCPGQGAYGSVKGWYVATDVSIAVTVAAAGVFTVLLAMSGKGPTSKSAALALEGWKF